jgi:hypothetical protein
MSESRLGRRVAKVGLVLVLGYVALSFLVGGLGLLLLWYWEQAGG